MSKKYAVRTVFLANFFAPGAEMANQRRSPSSTEALVTAMKRVELADQTLERELNAFAEKGYDLHTVIQHDMGNDDQHLDLLATLILSSEQDN